MKFLIYNLTFKLLLYTFENFPYINLLKEYFPEVVLFHQLKSDFKKFQTRINEVKPDIILGVAKIDGNVSYIENESTNKFNLGVIDKKGPSSISLFIPPKLPEGFRIRQNPTTSFCNWTMYKIAQYIQDTEIKLIFAHVTSEKSLSGLLDTISP